ncbi:MAG: helix-turn-helix transcriptional regulator [Eubacteriales bacterium]|nr:helix-turn-helix transcriptional regulator [Eubacteriales bacterium]
MKIWLDSTDIDFATRLKYRIKNCGYTQDEFAEELGIAKSTLVKYMSNTKNRIDPPLSIFVKMCDVLKTPYNYMLDGNIPFNQIHSSIYGLLINMGYDIKTNPENENEIAIEYHGKTVFLNYNDIEEKLFTFIDFLLYEKT